MNQNKIFETTKKAMDKSLEFTNSVMEKSKRLRKTSPKVAKIGMVIGNSIGIGLFLVGVIQLLIGKPIWAIGLLSVGTLTITSHIYIKSIKK